jgi:hypothetical protein
MNLNKKDKYLSVYQIFIRHIKMSFMDRIFILTILILLSFKNTDNIKHYLFNNKPCIIIIYKIYKDFH